MLVMEGICSATDTAGGRRFCRRHPYGKIRPTVLNYFPKYLINALGVFIYDWYNYWKTISLFSLLYSIILGAA
jgi:hypothetical protein